MQLFVANCTKQNHMFTYRLRGASRAVSLPISAGTQIKIDNLNKPEIDQIVKHQAIFGMVPVSEAAKQKKFVGCTYSIDTPVAMDRIAETIDRNDQALTDTATEIRTATVAAAEERLSETAQQTGGAKVNSVEMEVVEQKKNAGDTDKKFTQKITTKDGKRK